MKTLVLFSAVMLTLTSAHLASGAETERSHIGFFNPQAADLPVRVREATTSIFRISVVDKWGKIPKEEYARLVASEQFKKLSTAHQKINRYILEKCSQEQCLFPIGFSRGTGFLAGDSEGLRFWTAAHVIAPAIYAVVDDLTGFDEAVAARKITVPVFIFDRDENIIGAPDTLEASYIDGPKEKELIEKRASVGDYKFKDDFVELKLNRSFGALAADCFSGKKYFDSAHLQNRFSLLHRM